MQKAITVKLDSRDLSVAKLPLKKYADLIRALKELPKHADGFSGKTSSEVMSALPTIISESFPDFVNIISIATDLKAEEIEEMGLDDAIKIVEAIIQVNNYQWVFDKLKKAMAQYQTAKVTPPATTIG